MTKFVSRRTLLVLALIASVVAAIGAYSHAQAHSNGVAVRQLEPDAKSAQKHVGNAAATASDEKLPASLQSAAEAYAARAFPADSVSVELTEQAQVSWEQGQGSRPRQEQEQGRHLDTRRAELRHPAEQPQLLGQDLCTSGRVTAVAST